MLRRIANQLSTQPTNRRTHGDGAPQVFVYPHQPRVHRRTAGLASRWRQTVAFGDDKQLRLKRLRHSDLETAKPPPDRKVRACAKLKFTYLPPRVLGSLRTPARMTNNATRWLGWSPMQLRYLCACVLQRTGRTYV